MPDEDFPLGLTRGIERGLIFALCESMLFNVTRMHHLKLHCPWPVCFGKHWFKSSLKISLFGKIIWSSRVPLELLPKPAQHLSQGSTQTVWISYSESLFQRRLHGPQPTEAASLGWGPRICLCNKGAPRPEADVGKQDRVLARKMTRAEPALDWWWERET